MNSGWGTPATRRVAPEPPVHPGFGTAPAESFGSGHDAGLVSPRCRASSTQPMDGEARRLGIARMQESAAAGHQVRPGTAELNRVRRPAALAGAPQPMPAAEPAAPGCWPPAGAAGPSRPCTGPYGGGGGAAAAKSPQDPRPRRSSISDPSEREPPFETAADIVKWQEWARRKAEEHMGMIHPRVRIAGRPRTPLWARSNLGSADRRVGAGWAAHTLERCPAAVQAAGTRGCCRCGARAARSWARSSAWARSCTSTCSASAASHAS